MKHLQRLLLSTMLILVSTISYAQTEITGKVVDDLGEEVIGATVMEKGTSNGTVTDFEGNFKINVTEGTILVISYIGYQTMEVPAKNGMNVNISVKANNACNKKFPDCFCKTPSYQRMLALKKNYCNRF